MKSFFTPFISNFLSFTLIISSCSKDNSDSKDFIFNCIERSSGTISTKTESHHLLNKYKNKLIQFRDSIGTKLDLRFVNSDLFQISTKRHYSETLCYNGLTPVLAYYDLVEPGIYFQGIAYSKNHILTINVLLHLEAVHPEVKGHDINLLGIAENQNLIYSAYQTSNWGVDNSNPDNFGSQFLGDIKFRKVEYLGDTSNKTILYREVWKTINMIKINPVNHDLNLIENKHKSIFQSNELITEEIYFTKSEGIVAFKLKDGILWVLHEVF